MRTISSEGSDPSVSALAPAVRCGAPRASSTRSGTSASTSRAIARAFSACDGLNEPAAARVESSAARSEASALAAAMAFTPRQDGLGVPRENEVLLRDRHLGDFARQSPRRAPTTGGWSAWKKNPNRAIRPEVLKHTQLRKKKERWTSSHSARDGPATPPATTASPGSSLRCGAPRRYRGGDISNNIRLGAAARRPPMRVAAQYLYTSVQLGSRY